MNRSLNIINGPRFVFTATLVLLSSAAPLIAAAVKTVVILGSSTPAGAAASDWTKSWSGQLGTTLSAGNKWRVVNKSQSADTTAGGVSRFDADVASLDPDVCIIAYTLGNENLAGGSDTSATVSRYLANYECLIAKCKAAGIRPIVATPWPRNDYSLAHRAANVGAALQIATRSDVYSFDFTSPVIGDAGAYAEGLYGDSIHPNDNGHAAMFAAIATAIFETPLFPPEIVTRDFSGIRILQSTNSASPSVCLESIGNLSSFTFSARLAPEFEDRAYLSIGDFIQVRLERGDWVLSHAGRESGRFPARGIGEWDHLAISYNRFGHIVTFWVNGVSVSTVRLEIHNPFFGVFGGIAGLANGSGRLRDLALHRVPLAPEFVAALAGGAVLRASAEILSPCSPPLHASSQITNYAGTGRGFRVAPGVAFVSTGDVLEGTQLANVSARLAVNAGSDTSIVGVALSGAGPHDLLVRAAGPALRQFGVSDFLPAPALEVRDRDGRVVPPIASSSNEDEVVAEASQAVGAFPFDSNKTDAACLVRVPSGTYTVLVRSRDSAAGIVLVEVYRLPP